MKRKNPHLVYFIADSTPSGGPMHLLNLVKNLGDEYEITVVGPAGFLQNEIERLGCRYLPMAMRVSQLWKINQIVKSVANNERLTIYHFQGVRAGRIGGLLPTPKKNSFYIYTEHLWTMDYGLGSSFRTWLQRLELRMWTRRFDQIICVSKAVKSFYEKELGVSPQKTCLIYNGVEPPILKKQDDGRHALGSIITNHPLKGLDILLEAYGSFDHKNDWPLLIVGGQDILQNKLWQNVQKKWSSLVSIIPSGSDLEKTFWSRVGIYIQPSKSEAFGMAVVEAAMAGKAVIASPKGALPEVLDNRHTVMKNLSAACLKESLENVTNEYDIYKNKALDQAAFFRQIYSLPTMVQGYRDLYQSLS